MADTTNHWKLGLFVVLGVLVAVGTLLGLGASKLQQQVVTFVTYFDESVQGLEIGSPVKFRGVTIGNVSEISVAPDRRHVEVTSTVDVDKLQRLGLREEGALPAAAGAVDERFVPPNLRIQLVSAGITGVKFLQADFFEVETHPQPALSFEVPPNYIPAVESTLKSIEANIVSSLERLPEITDQVSTVLARVDTTLIELEAGNLSQAAQGAIARVDSFLAVGQETMEAGQRSLEQLDVPGLRTQADTLVERFEQSLSQVDKAVTRVDGLLARIEDEDGLLTSLERTLKTLEGEIQGLQLAATLRGVDGSVASITSTSNAVRSVVEDAQGFDQRMARTLTAVEEAAAAVARLAETLERDPDMLLKGRISPDE